MRIGEVAGATGVSARSVRYYEAKGLISADRTPSGWRDFAPETIARIRAIQHLFAAGLSSTTIADILPCLDASPADRTDYLKDALDAHGQRLIRERHRIDVELRNLDQLRHDTTTQTPRQHTHLPRSTTPLW